MFQGPPDLICAGLFVLHSTRSARRHEAAEWCTRLRCKTEGSAYRRGEDGGASAGGAGERRPAAGGGQGVHFAAQALALSARAQSGLWAFRNYFAVELDLGLTFMLQSKAGLNKSFFAIEFKREGQARVQTG